MKSVILNRIILLLSAAGIFVSGFLTYSYLGKLSIPCGASKECDVLAQLPESQWFGLPVPLFGLIGYLLIFGLAVIRTMQPEDVRRKLGNIGFVISTVGFITSMFLIYQLAMVLNLRCQWCLASAGLMLLIFIFSASYIAQKELGSERVAFDFSYWPALLVIALGSVGAMGTVKREQMRAIVKLEASKIDLGEIAPSSAYFYGPPSAPVTVVEFADFFCPACRQTSGVLKGLVEKYPGKVRVAFRNLPLFQVEGHEMSLPAAVASEIAASEEKYWDFIDIVFSERYAKVASSDVFLDILEQIGVARGRGEKLIGDTEGAPFKRVVEGVDAANKLGVKVTPSFLVIANGVQPVVVTSERIQNLLDEPQYQKAMKGSNE